jgi:hypothetical protein
MTPHVLSSMPPHHRSHGCISDTRTLGCSNHGTSNQRAPNQLTCVTIIVMVKMAHNQREMRLGLFFQSTHALGDFTSRCLLFLSINSQLLFWFELVVVFVSQFPAAHRRQLFVKKYSFQALLHVLRGYQFQIPHISRRKYRGCAFQCEIAGHSRSYQCILRQSTDKESSPLERCLNNRMKEVNPDP